MFRGYFWFCTRESLLVGPGHHAGFLGIKCRLAACRHTPLPSFRPAFPKPLLHPPSTDLLALIKKGPYKTAVGAVWVKSGNFPSRHRPRLQLFWTLLPLHWPEYFLTQLFSQAGLGSSDVVCVPRNSWRKNGCRALHCSLPLRGWKGWVFPTPRNGGRGNASTPARPLTLAAGLSPLRPPLSRHEGLASHGASAKPMRAEAVLGVLPACLPATQGCTCQEHLFISPLYKGRDLKGRKEGKEQTDRREARFPLIA